MIIRGSQTSFALRRLLFHEATTRPYFVSVFLDFYVISEYGPWTRLDPEGSPPGPAIAAAAGGDQIIIIMNGDGLGAIGSLPCDGRFSEADLRAAFRHQLAAMQTLQRPQRILFAGGEPGHRARAALLDEARNASGGAPVDWLDPENEASIYTYAVYLPYDDKLLLFTAAEQARIPWDDPRLICPMVVGTRLFSYP